MILNFSDLFLGFIGGLIMGLACTIHYVTKGRITGISGIYYGVITFNWGEFYWKLALLSSLVFATGVMHQIFGDWRIMENSSFAFDDIEEISNISNTIAAISGLCIGIGAKLCNGCTTGHGFCGMARLSLRSFVAMGLFILFGVISSSVTQSEKNILGELEYNQLHVSIVFIGLSLVLMAFSVFGAYLNPEQFIDTIIAIPVGIILGVGLVISGMIRRTMILGLLSLESWNPQLIFVILGAVIFNYFGFKQFNKPFFDLDFSYPPTKKVDNFILIGAALFGFGWGMTGICPLVGIGLFPQFTWQVGLMYLGSVSMGMRIGQCFLQKCGQIPDNQIIVNEMQIDNKTTVELQDKS